MGKNDKVPRLGDKIKTNPGLLKIEPNGKLKLSEYSVINQIGKGTFGKIYAVKWKKNDKKYALKKELLYNLELVEKRNNIVEIIHDFLEKTNNKGVMTIFSNLWEKNKNEYNYYELMEIGERDWEKEIISRSKSSSYYTENELFNIASQLIKTLALLQKNRITHRDIKPQNILIVNGQYKLCDFGEIRIMKREEGIVVQRIRGSELYMSPILFFGLRNGLIQVKHNTYKSDVYSLGMCLLYAASMHFSGTDEIREMTDMEQIKETLYKYLGDRYSNNLISLIHSMLETEENLRPDFISLEKKLDSYK
jgi:NIMA (never in mitosis gene a)-related kinase